MLKIEFETLTHVEVSDNLYYNVIEPFYMSVDTDKQTFCKMWLKMNATKVRYYKEWQKDKFVLFALVANCINNKSVTAEQIEVANKWGATVGYMSPSETARRVTAIDNKYNTINL